MADMSGTRHGGRLPLIALVATAVLLAPAATATAADTVPPSTPTGLTVTGTTAASISVKWNASTDNVGVTHYRVFRNVALAGTTSARSYTLPGLNCGATYIVSVSAADAAGNKSLPATTLATTAACALTVLPCPTPADVYSQLLEHKLAYGCGWPDGWAARQALNSARAFLSTRSGMLTDKRAKKWLKEVLAELDAATETADAWSTDGRLLANRQALKVQYRVGRAIRLLHWSNRQLFEVSRADKGALAAISWYIAASQYNATARSGGDPDTLARAKFDLQRADSDFFAANMYRAWGRYRSAWQRLTGLL
jgi:hypothetical protein